MLENLEAPGLHPSQHVHKTGFDAHALLACPLNVVGELRKHVETLVGILPRECDASAFESLAVPISGPTPAQFAAPRTQRSGMFNWRCLPYPIRPRNINSVRIAVVDQFH